MRRRFLAKSPLLFLLVYVEFTYSKVHYITPSLDSPCPQNASSCLTLSKFAANSSHNEADISLLFLPGNHFLDKELLLAHGHSFSMSKYVEGNKTVFVECTSHLGKFDISKTKSVSIKGLHFIGCGSNRVSQVTWLTITDSTFQEVKEKRTVLVINEVDNANIVRSQFHHNTLEHHYNIIMYHPQNTFSGVLYTAFSNVSIVSCRFMYNRADIGGALVANNSRLHIDRSAYSYNTANVGGAIFTSGSIINIDSGIFTHNSAQDSGGAIAAHKDRISISSTMFTTNTADRTGGALYTSGNSSFTISCSNFTSNRANHGGVMCTTDDSSFTISDSNFTSNSASSDGGVVYTRGKSSFTISKVNFTSNNAVLGGVMYSRKKSSFKVSNSTFTSNRARGGGVMCTSENSLFTITGSNFTNNNANTIGGVIQYTGGTLNIDNSNFNSNTINTLGGGMIFISQCSANIANSAFHDNVGSIFAFNSNLIFSGHGYSKFDNCKAKHVAGNESTCPEGGVITSFQSTVVFARESTTHFSNNQAKYGGAMLAVESTIIMYGETTIANNNIANSNGGGIALKQSHLEIKGKCHLVNNSAVRGGGIHATSSTIAVHTPGTLQIIGNYAKFGGGISLETDSKLYVLKKKKTCGDFLNFTGNHANYGGAVHVADVTNSGTCLNENECFIQTLALHQLQILEKRYTLSTHFSENTATVQGSDLFGGLLDRCILSPFAEVYRKQKVHYSGVSYLQNISNADINSISSQPVRVCFCNSEHKPDCSYQLLNITVKKGEAFNVSVVAVDQVNNTVDANITTSISSSEGGFGEGQQTQSVRRNCTDLTYNVFSPHDSETINLFADGPCGHAALSTSNVTIHFTDCTCPVGFQPLSNSRSSTNCECVCDSKLSPFITHCDDNISSVFRVGTNSWITYINDTDQHGYVIYPYCPFDYCQPLTKNVSINFNLPNGTDTQCAYNRTGVLCGSCRGRLSLSLASSRCLPCHSYWPAECVVILLVAILAGILLVTALLALNMTVSIGLINGFIFYADIISAGNAVFCPSSEPIFPSVFVSWLNLDIGIDVCFIDGLDAYIKTWLQLAFPLYIISLVVIVIIVSEYSPRFASLIGRKDPISTLATLILISYSKLLSVTITALSFTTLDYPDGNQEIVWRPDGNVKYFQGKHILLVLVAVLVILIGIPYTVLLFLWQWIVRASKWKIFKWTRNTKLNAFIAIYHVPHNSKYRYWTGLLLLVRVVLYATASLTVSVNPQTLPLIAGILIGSLFLFKGLFALRVYKNLLVDVVDTVLYFNLLALSLFSLYDFKVNRIKQTAVAYTSTIITFFLFIGSICYHVRLLIKKYKPAQDLNESTRLLVHPVNAEVTYSVIEPPSDFDRDNLEITDDHHIVTPPYYTE